MRNIGNDFFLDLGGLYLYESILFNRLIFGFMKVIGCWFKSNIILDFFGECVKSEN